MYSELKKIQCTSQVSVAINILLLCPPTININLLLLNKDYVHTGIAVKGASDQLQRRITLQDSYSDLIIDKHQILTIDCKIVADAHH